MRRWNFQGNILVSNLSEDVTPAGLAELFDDYGLVLGVQIKEVVSNANTRIIGIVALAPEPAVEKAIAGLQGYLVDERKIKLKKTTPREKTATPATRAALPRAAYTTSIKTPVPAAFASESPSSEASYAIPRPATRKVVVEYRSTTPRTIRMPLSRPRTDSSQDV